MIRDVDLVSYLPPFMQSYSELVAALDAEVPEFQIIWQAADRVLKNRFISTADEYGISRFEKLLSIFPSKDDTLESRRARLQSRWFNKLPYTLRILMEKLTALCSDTDFTLTHNFAVGYTLTLETHFELYGQVEELKRLVNTLVPVNIAVEVENRNSYMVSGGIDIGGGLCMARALQIRYVLIES